MPLRCEPALFMKRLQYRENKRLPSINVGNVAQDCEMTCQKFRRLKTFEVSPSGHVNVKYYFHEKWEPNLTNCLI